MRPQLRTCVLLRFIREATNVLLPLAQVGGDLIGAGLLTLYAVPGALAAASVIVDILIQAATQFLFAILGLLTLVALEADQALARNAAVGIAVATLMLAGFYLAQRRGGQRILRAIVSRLTGDREWRVLGTIDAVYQNLGMIYAARSNVVASAVVHLGDGPSAWPKSRSCSRSWGIPSASVRRSSSKVCSLPVAGRRL